MACRSWAGWATGDVFGRKVPAGIDRAMRISAQTEAISTDLVGSRRVATFVDPAWADELREEHFGLLRDAISACEGKEVKNTGDGLMVPFASASAAAPPQ